VPAFFARLSSLGTSDGRDLISFYTSKRRSVRDILTLANKLNDCINLHNISVLQQHEKSSTMLASLLSLRPSVHHPRNSNSNRSSKGVNFNNSSQRRSRAQHRQLNTISTSAVPLQTSPYSQALRDAAFASLNLGNKKTPRPLSRHTLSIL
jgi:hypothetical protein